MVRERARLTGLKVDGGSRQNILCPRVLGDYACFFASQLHIYKSVSLSRERQHSSPLYLIGLMNV